MNVKRELAEDSFEYGNHEIHVWIGIKHTNAYENVSNLLSGPGGFAYFRVVRVSAVKDDEEELAMRTYVNLEPDDKPPETITLPLIGEIQVSDGFSKPSIPEQVEETVRPILKELDELYEITMPDYEVEIEVALERVRHSTSWADIDMKADEISRELGMEPTN